ITLAKDGRLALDFKEYATFEAMEPDLKLKLALSESKLVVLRADEAAMHGKLVDLMGKAKDAGAQALTIATEQKRKTLL
ncbi:MAG: biopolymer transporter ExbD, partial [Elusimicrobiota bacterium]